MIKSLFLSFLILLSIKGLAQNHKILNAKVTYYSKKFDGRKTYSGERFNSNLYTAAHKSFPLQSLVKITNPKNNKEVIVRINDRFRRKNYIDVTYIAAEKLGILSAGVAKVKIQLLDTSFIKEYINQDFIEKSNNKTDSISSEVTSDTIFHYYIRIASLKMKKNADLFIKQKLAKEYKNQAFIKKSTYRKKPLYKVMIGPFKTKSEATEILSKLYPKYKDASIVNQK